MRRNEARIALQAAREWNAKGMFKPGAFEHIEKTLAEKAAEPSIAMQSFYAIGGIMLGAATAALYALLELNDVISDDPSTAWSYFLACAVVLLGAGIGIHLARQKDLGDAILLGGLVPTAILFGPTPPIHDVLLAVPTLMAGGILAFRRKAYLLPIVSLGLVCVGIPVFMFRALGYDLFQSDDPAMWSWLMAAFVMWLGVAMWNRFARPAWDDEGAGATTLALGIAWAMTVFETMDIRTAGVSEVVVGLGLGAIIGAGVLLKERGIIFVAGIGLTIDAIGFAFDIGGPTVGLVTLLALAAGLIALATVMRRRKTAETGSSPEA